MKIEHHFDLGIWALDLAALRYWQGSHQRLGPLHDIATDGGTLEPLTAEQIDALCERLNVKLPVPAQPPQVPEVTLSACCHAVIGWDAWVDSNEECCGGPYDYTQCCECGEDADIWDGTSEPTNPNCDALKDEARGE